MMVHLGSCICARATAVLAICMDYPHDTSRGWVTGDSLPTRPITWSSSTAMQRLERHPPGIQRSAQGWNNVHAGSPMMAYRFHDAAAATLERVSDCLEMLWPHHRQQSLVQSHFLFSANDSLLSVRKCRTYSPRMSCSSTPGCVMHRRLLCETKHRPFKAGLGLASGATLPVLIWTQVECLAITLKPFAII